MFSIIMVPVDLSHADNLDKAISVAANLAKQYNADATLVGVTQSGPTDIAHTPEEYSEKLAAFAAEHSTETGVTFATHVEISHDPTIDLDDKLMQASNALDADLIVMASHVPGFSDYIFSSNAGYLASHSKLSVFVVR